MFDIIRFCETYHIPYVDKGKNVHTGWIGINCPFCYGDTGYHFGFNLETGGKNCWKCGTHTLTETICQLLFCPPHEAKKIIKEFQVGDGKAPVFNSKQKSSVQYVQLPKEKLSKRERNYLTLRGYNPDEMTERYDLRSGGIAGRWAFRIVLPIFDIRGKIVSAVGRAITKQQEIRYWGLPDNMSIVPWKDTLYGLHLINPTSRSVVVVEGPFDQWRMGSGSVATYGTGFTDAQVSLLAHRFDHINILYDGDTGGRKGADRLTTALAIFGTEIDVFYLPDNTEPDTWDDNEREWFIKRYMNYGDFRRNTKPMERTDFIH
jgi:hypothetical protein